MWSDFVEASPTTLSRRAFVVGAAFAPVLTSAHAGVVSAAQNIEVGILLPLSGPAAPVGINQRRGHELAMEEINAGGGIRSLGGARLVMVDADTQGKPNIGVAEARELAGRGVAAILGAYESAVTYPVTEVTESLKVPFIDPVATADRITEGRGFEYLFKVSPKASWYGRDQLRFLKHVGQDAGAPVEKIVLIHETSTFADALAAGQRAAAAEHGIEVLDELTYPVGSPDVTATIALARDMAPDALVLMSSRLDAVRIAEALKALDVTIPVVGTSGGHYDPRYVAALGEDANFTLTIGEWSPDIAETGAAEVGARFMDKFGIPMNGQAAETYMATMVLRDALERAASAEREAVRSALAETKLCGAGNILPYDCIQFDESGQSKTSGLIMLQVQDGDYKTVWPRKVASAPLIWPIPAWSER